MNKVHLITLQNILFWIPSTVAPEMSSGFEVLPFRSKIKTFAIASVSRPLNYRDVGVILVFTSFPI